MAQVVTVNSLSGGKTSSYMAIHYPTDVNIFACVCIDDPDCTPKDPAVFKYCTDKLNGNFIASAESEKTLKILMQLEQLIGKEIVWVRGKSFDRIIDEAGCLPTWNRRFCTTEMKILPIFEYCYFRYGVVQEQIGYRYDEMWRAIESVVEEMETHQLHLYDSFAKDIVKIKRSRINAKSFIKDYPIKVRTYGERRQKLRTIHWAYKVYPLIDDKIDTGHIKKFWTRYPDFIFPRTSNCQGCHHKSKADIKANHEDEPAILQWFARQEKKGKFHTWHDDQISYERVFEMNFDELIEFSGYNSCNSGYCLMD